MRHKFLVNPALFLYSALIAAILAMLTLVMVYSQRIVSAIVFLQLTLLFTGVAIYYSAVLTVDNNGVSRSVFGIRRKFLLWDEIEEVGIGGTKILHAPGAKHVGTLYIYFSASRLTDEERFNMFLRWPHWNQCYMRFSQNRLRAVQMQWNKEIATYNVGDLTVDDGRKN